MIDWRKTPPCPLCGDPLGGVIVLVELDQGDGSAGVHEDCASRVYGPQSESEAP